MGTARDHARIFYTSLGMPKGFPQNPNFRRLLVNGSPGPWKSDPATRTRRRRSGVDRVFDPPGLAFRRRGRPGGRGRAPALFRGDQSGRGRAGRLGAPLRPLDAAQLVALSRQNDGAAVAAAEELLRRYTLARLTIDAEQMLRSPGRRAADARRARLADVFGAGGEPGAGAGPDSV